MATREPIVPPDQYQLGLLRYRYRHIPGSADQLDKLNREWIFELKFKKLAKLAREHGIPEFKAKDNYLALALATKHEPGFQVVGFEKPVGKRGRPLETKIERLELLNDVDEIMDREGLATPTEACNRLAGRGRWAGRTPHALEMAYSRANKLYGGELDETDPFVRFALKRLEAENPPDAQSQKQVAFNVRASGHNGVSPDTNGDTLCGSRAIPSTILGAKQRSPR